MANIKINQNAFKTKKKWIRHKIEAGNNVYRVLPPFGDEEVTNCYPFKRWSTVWLVDKESGKQLPIATPFTTGQDCPIREYTEKLVEYISERKAILTSEGKSEDEIKEDLHELNQLSWKTAVKTTYAYNAVNKGGDVGILELKATAHKSVKTMMSQYILDYDQDPTSIGSEDDDSGVWFNIKRDGIGKNTEYSAEFNQTKEKDAAGRLIKLDDRSALPAAVVTNLDDLCYDLFKIYKIKTYEETLEMLKYHLHTIQDVCPEAVLPGYAWVPAVEEVKEEIKTAPKTQGTAKVTVNLGADDLPEDDATVTTEAKGPVTKAREAAEERKTAPAATSTGIKAGEDIDSMLADILG